MTCNLCEDNYGISLCNCTYLMCNACIDKLEFPNCPQCRSRLNIKLFFSGKITTLSQDESTRRFVFKSDNGNFEDIKHYLRNKRYGNLTIKDEDIVYYDDYIKVEQELPIQQITPTTALTGPYVIVDDKCLPHHAVWESYMDVKSISDIVNKRNYQAIANCDVFVLNLNIMYDCFRSIAEWGIASSMGKTLIILFPEKESYYDEIDFDYNRSFHKILMDYTDLKMERNRHEWHLPVCDEENDEIEKLTREFIEKRSDKMQSEFYMFAVESIKTLDKLSFTKKEAIFTSHPNLNITYKEYVKKLQNIISKKNHNKENNAFCKQCYPIMQYREIRHKYINHEFQKMFE